MPVASLEEYERLDPRYTVQALDATVTYCTPTLQTKARVDSLFWKEPCTIEWIAGFRAHDILLDIGANVGMYTILAAAARGCRVVAFEPEAQSFAVLNKNIFVNKLGDRVTAFCIGLSDVNGLSVLHVSNFAAGMSNHTVGEDIDHCLRPRRSAYGQGCVAARLDDLIDAGGVPVPSRIKLDVDGLEHRVARGAWKTLQRPELRSVLVEINRNLDEHLALVRSLGDIGFRYEQRQVDEATRRSGPFEGCAEYVFSR